MSFSYKNRPKKAAWRERLLRDAHSRVHHDTNMILLPGPECIDLRMMVADGTIDRDDTHVHLVEYNKDHMEDVEMWVDSLGLRKVSLHCGELKDYRPDLEKPIGFAFVDLTGLPDAGLFEWFGWLAEKLYYNSVVGFTWSGRVPKHCFPRKVVNHTFFKQRRKQSPLLQPLSDIACASAIVLDILTFGSHSVVNLGSYREKKTDGKSACPMYTSIFRGSGLLRDFDRKSQRLRRNLFNILAKAE